MCDLITDLTGGALGNTGKNDVECKLILGQTRFYTGPTGLTALKLQALVKDITNAKCHQNLLFLNDFITISDLQHEVQQHFYFRVVKTEQLLFYI